MKIKKHMRGFTLLELAFVMVISGFIMAGLTTAWQNYIFQERIDKTYEHIQTIDSSITTFFAAQGRYPCPADPSLDINDPEAGIERCWANLSPITNNRYTKYGVYKILGNPLASGMLTNILIGAVPYKTLKMDNGTGGTSAGTASVDVLDGWGHQFTYAVTQNMTITDKFRQDEGAIAVTTEDPNQSLIDPPGRAHYVIVSAGDDGVGAYTAGGTLITADTGQTCQKATFNQPSPYGSGPMFSVSLTTTNGGIDPDAGTQLVNCNQQNTFVAGLRNTNGSLPTSYFDDIVFFKSSSASSLWAAIVPPVSPTAPPAAIYNLNPGNVGIGTSTPSEKLTIETAVGQPPAVALATDGFNVAEICDVGGADCVNPRMLTNLCGPQAGDPAYTTRFMTGIVYDPLTRIPQPKCSGPVPAPTSIQIAACPVGQFMFGYHMDGTILCAPPPPPPVVLTPP